MLSSEGKYALLASTLVLLVAFGGGCLQAGSGGQDPTSAGTETGERVHTTTVPPGERLSYRLIVAPETPSDTTTRVTITSVADGDTVFDGNVTLDREHDLSRHFDPASDYRVRIETNGHVDTYGIADYEGYKVYVNDSGVVRVEKEVI